MPTQIERGSKEDPSGQLDQSQMEMIQKMIKRVLLLADRDRQVRNGRLLDTDEDVRRLDEMFNQMSPPSEGGGKRQSVEIYEVAIDKRLGD